MADGAIGGQLGHPGWDSVLGRVGTGAARDLGEPTAGSLDLADEVDETQRLRPTPSFAGVHDRTCHGIPPP